MGGDADEESPHWIHGDKSTRESLKDFATYIFGSIDRLDQEHNEGENRFGANNSIGG